MASPLSFFSLSRRAPRAPSAHVPGSRSARLTGPQHIESRAVLEDQRLQEVRIRIVAAGRADRGDLRARLDELRVEAHSHEHVGRRPLDEADDAFLAVL